MKPVTGKTNSPKTSENKVSIQLMLGGHSFSADGLEKQLEGLLPTDQFSAAEIVRSGERLNGGTSPRPGCGPVPADTDGATAERSGAVRLTACVNLLTDKTALAPQALFEADHAAAWLHMTGIPCSGDELPVWSDPGSEPIAVMALPRKAAEVLHRYFGTAIHYDSPLRLLAPRQEATRPTVCIHDAAPFIYIKVYTPQELQFAEAVSCETTEEFAYLLQRLDAAFTLRAFTAELSGTRTKAWKKESKPYFGNILCV